MAETNTDGYAPCKKMNWLKGLLDEDEDSSDPTPQPKELGKLEVKSNKILKKSPKLKPRRAGTSTINDSVTLDRKKQQGSDRRVKKQRHEGIGGTDGEDTPAKRSTHRQSESGERHLHHKCQLGDNRMASLADMKGVNREQKHPKRLEKKGGKMIQRKRTHDELEFKEKEKIELLKNTVDPAKAEAAARRQRRMKKLQARRKATGECERLAAVKLKRHELSEASRLKRNQRSQMRKTQKLPAAADLDPEVKGEGKTRPPPPSSEEAKERKRILERRPRAAIKAKKQLGVGLNSSLASVLKRPRLVDSDEEKRVQRQNEVRLGLGADYGDKVHQKRQKREHMKVGRESAAGSCLSHVQSPNKMIEGRAAGENSAGIVTISTVRHDDDVPGILSSSDTNNIGVSESQEQSAQNKKSCRDNTVKEDVREEGEIDSAALLSSSAAIPVEPLDKDEKEISDMKQDLILDMAPIPRKSIIRNTSATSFVIPKRSVKITDGNSVGSHNDQKPLGVRIPVGEKPLASSESDPPNSQLSSRNPIRSQRMRTKNRVPVKNSMFSAQDRALMRLARKRNSIFWAAAELTAQPSPVDNKVSAARVTGYEVCDTNGDVLPDLVSRWSCATKREMALDKDSFNASFFGVSLGVPEAKGKANPTVDECANVEDRKMNCYEELRFERPEDREIYQRRMYGSTFVPQYLRGRATLIIRSARFERKSTGIRFNQDRDREEFSASLSKRYTFDKSVPRCEIPRENWQKIMRSQSAVVYLHYNNREDAERAAYVFRDDSGNPLELKNEYKSRVGSSRNLSPANGVGTRWAPRRSCSSERSPPHSSPLSSQGDSARNTPQWQRERQRVTNRYSRYDRPPSAQRNGQEDHYGSSAGGRRSRSRSRSRSRPRRFPDEQYDAAAKRSKSETGNDEVRTNKELLSEKPMDEPALPTCEPLADIKEIGNTEHQRLSSTNKSDTNGVTESNTYQRAALPTALCSPRTASQSKGLHEQDLESGEDEQEDGEIESSTVPVAETTDRSKDRRRRQRSRSSPRSMWQPNDVQSHQRQGDYRDRPYAQHYNRGPTRQRSRSRSRPRPEGFAPWGKNEYGDGRNDSYAKERRSREYDPVHDYDNDGQGRRMYSGDMDRYGGRDYRSGRYNDRRGDAYSRHY